MDLFWISLISSSLSIISCIATIFVFVYITLYYERKNKIRELNSFINTLNIAYDNFDEVDLMQTKNILKIKYSNFKFLNTSDDFLITVENFESICVSLVAFKSLYRKLLDELQRVNGYRKQIEKIDKELKERRNEK